MHTTKSGRFFSVLLIAFLCALLLRVFVVEGYLVQGDSMYPTLMSDDYAFVYKLAYWNSEPKRGDIIVAYPRQYDLKVIKRVTVLPGEVFEAVPGKRDKLDPREYFLVGDNMPVSIDSRVFGPIDRWDIQGRVFGVIRFKDLKYLDF
jgi:signal peptidase I